MAAVRSFRCAFSRVGSILSGHPARRTNTYPELLRIVSRKYGLSNMFAIEHARSLRDSPVNATLLGRVRCSTYSANSKDNGKCPTASCVTRHSVGSSELAAALDKLTNSATLTPTQKEVMTWLTRQPVPAEVALENLKVETAKCEFQYCSYHIP